MKYYFYKYFKSDEVDSVESEKNVEEKKTATVMVPAPLPATNPWGKGATDSPTVPKAETPLPVARQSELAQEKPAPKVQKPKAESLPKKEADKKPVVEKPASVKVEKKPEEKSVEQPPASAGPVKGWGKVPQVAATPIQVLV